MIESLGSRLLFAALVPDVGWGYDGRIDEAYDGTAYLGQSAGRLLVQHRSYNDDDATSISTSFVRRYHADGTTDRRFQALVFDDDLFTVAQDAAGRVVLAATGSGGPSSPADSVVNVVRYTTTGRRDRSFAATLRFSPPRGQRNLHAAVQSVQALPDGGAAMVIDVSGERKATGERVSRTVLAKVTPAGTPDATFGSKGLLELDATSTKAAPKPDLFVDPRSRLYLQSETGLTRLAADGTVAARYGNTANGHIAFDSAGRLVIALPSTVGASIQRYTDAGTLDPTFGTRGIVNVVTAGEAGVGVRALFADGDALVVQVGDEIHTILNGKTDHNTGDTSASVLLGPSTLGGYLAQSGGTPTHLKPPATVDLGTSGTIYLRTGDAADSVYVRAEDADRVRVGLNGTVTRYPRQRISAIDVYLGGGDNAFTTSLDVRTSVVAGAGRDTIVTGGGSDHIDTGRGSDRIQSGGGGDTVVPGAGNNTVDLGTATDDQQSGVYVNNIFTGSTVVRGRGGRLYVDVDNTIDLTFTGFTAWVDLQSSHGNNRVRLDTKEDSNVTGGRGDDSIVTGGGDDVLYGGPGRDTLRAGAGDDILYGSGGFDDTPPLSPNVLDGGPGTDRYQRESKDDELIDVETSW